MAEKKSVLFVCLGNICRSPIAEAVFQHLVKERALQDKWSTDSAGTGDWHVGNLPDKRARQCMQAHNVEMNHRARLLTKEDFSTYTFIFGMDEANIRDINSVAPKSPKAKVELLGSYDPEGELVIEDPYYQHGSDGFEKVYQQCIRSCNAFLEKLS